MHKPPLKIGIKFQFDSSHRIIGHYGKCKYLHGHRYSAEIEVASDKLDEMGFVVDFGIIKPMFKKWIDDNLDHNCILSFKDNELGASISKITHQNICYLDKNPTVENICNYMLENLEKLISNSELKNKIKISKIKLYETETCYSEISA